MARPITFTANSGATAASLSTTSKFGTYSLDFNDFTNWYVSSEPLIPSTGDFTLEFWHRVQAADNTRIRYLFRQWNTTFQSGMALFTNSNNSGRYQLSLGGETIQEDNDTPSTVFKHIAVVRSGSNIKLFVNGVKATNEITYSGTIEQTPAFIGGQPSGGATYNPTRFIDEFRVSDIARYSANFTPQTAAFVNDDQTVVLLHMEQNPPTDDSANPIRLGAAAMQSSAALAVESKVIDQSKLINYKSIQSNLFVRIKIDEWRANSTDAYEEKILRFSDKNSSFVINGETYLGLGGFVSITSSESEIRASEAELTITLSGIPNSSILEILNSKIKSSEVTVYRGLFDAATGTLLNFIPVNPLGRYKGFVNNYSLQEDYDPATRTSTNTLVIVCASAVSILENKFAGRKTNPRSQKAFYPNDAAMDRVPALENSVFNFGVPK